VHFSVGRAGAEAQMGVTTFFQKEELRRRNWGTNGPQ